VGEKILRVNEEAIDASEIQREAEAMLKAMAERMPGEDPRTLRAKAREWAEENLIEVTLLRQAALREPGPDAAPEVRVQRLVDEITSHAAPPKHKEIVAFYLKNRESFLEPEKIRAAHIVKNVGEGNSEETARAEIERARDELAKGRPFAEVADAISDCPGNGGEIPPFARGEMVGAFEDVVFALKPGAVSPVFRTEFGFHIAKLIERLPAGIPRLEDVRDRIEAHLLEEKKRKRLHQHLDHLRARAVIVREEVPAR
jgi:hypothetical protein